ncbi:hypothetical protein [Haloprofundus marisrubri]|nr:hypothetical protein [Haloprofundus marisrubri]
MLTVPRSVLAGNDGRVWDAVRLGMGWMGHGPPTRRDDSGGR